LHGTKPCELNDPSPRMHSVFANAPKPVDGLFHVPTRPGLGLDFIDSELEKRRISVA